MGGLKPTSNTRQPLAQFSPGGTTVPRADYFALP
jgi:hypothetical protein